MIEWILCVPLLIALIAFVFGLLFLTLEQIQLQVLCTRTADHIANIDIDELLLESEARTFVRLHSHPETLLVFDHHYVDEKKGTDGTNRPPIDIVGIRLERRPIRFPGLQLGAYARAARIR